jgi:hypothetical protein
MSFAPTDIAGCVCWLKADAIVGLADGDPVASWEDQASTNDFVQATAGYKPVYKTNIVSGMPVVRFDGSDDFLSTSANIFVDNSNFTIFMVHKDACYGRGNGLSSWSGLLGAASAWVATTVPGTDSFSVYGDSIAGGFGISAITFSQGSSLERFVGNVSQGTVAPGSTLRAGGGTTDYLGMNYDSAYTAGDIAEFIVYNSVLSESDRTSVYAYLTEKYVQSISASIVVAPTLSATLQSFHLAGSIVISPQLSGTFMRGRAGDIDAPIVISPLLSASFDYVPPPLIDGRIVISPIVSGTFVYGPQATVNVVLPSLTMEAEGYDFPLGNLSKVMASILLLATGDEGCIGELNQILPSFVLSAFDTFNITGSAALTVPKATLSQDVLVNEDGTFSNSLPSLFLSAIALRGEVGSLVLSFPSKRIESDSYFNESGELSHALPSLILLARSSPQSYTSMVMNVRNRAVTEYTNYLFNSMARFNGKHLGASGTAIYDLDTGDTDDGTIISWNFLTGYLDMVDLNFKKKAKQAWITYKSNGDLIFTVAQPNGESYEYEVSAVDIYEDGVRIKLGKGIRSRYIAFGLSSVDGSTLALDAMKLHFEKIEKPR